MTSQQPPGTAKSSSTRSFWVIIGLAAVLLVAYLIKSGSPGGATSVPSILSSSRRAPAPDLGVRQADDASKTVSLRSLKGKVVVLHFWATWCPPCRAEFPEFAKFAVSSESQAAWEVLPISIDDSAQPIGPFMSKIQGKFQVYWDPGTLANALGISAVPTTIVLDKEGRVAWQGQGVTDWSANGVPAIVKSLSNE